MLYRFIKDQNGNNVRIGDTTAELLEEKLQGYLNNGFTLGSAEEYDAELIKGATSTPAPGATSESAPELSATEVTLEA